MFRTTAILILSFAGIAGAQDRKATSDQPQQDEAARKRLKSVTWDLASHKLLWVVETGKLEGKEFIPDKTDKYEISPDEARMKYAEETRGFSEVEAASLHKLLDTLSIYCAESVVWWDQGEGQKVDGDGKRKSETVDQKKSTTPAATEGLLYAIARTLR